MGMMDSLNEMGTVPKILIGIGVCCIGLVIIGLLTGGITTDINTSTSDTRLGTQVKITTNGNWVGSMGTEGNIASYEGTGDSVINIDASSNDRVAAVVQKMDAGNDELKVEILRDGNVVKTGSTTLENGRVTVTD